MAVSTGYVVRETGVNLKRNLLMTIAAIIIPYLYSELRDDGK